MRKNLAPFAIIFLVSCANTNNPLRFLTQDPEKIKAENAKDSFMELAEGIEKDPLYGEAFQSLSRKAYPTSGKEFLFSISGNGAEGPQRALLSYANSDSEISHSLLTASKKLCAESQTACPESEGLEKIQKRFDDCEAGSARECAMKAVELEETFPKIAAIYFKKACVLGHEKSCAPETNARRIPIRKNCTTTKTIFNDPVTRCDIEE